VCCKNGVIKLKLNISLTNSRPGPIDTPFFHGQESKESVDFFTNATPLKRLGQVTDVVPVVEFLCLPESQWVTAQTILINGGLISR
jgi:NAD(P)-dependent dehydrogenase (short-subunit alcohol dehydrogenase family)